MPTRVGNIEKYTTIAKIEESNYATVYKVKDDNDNVLALKIARDQTLNEIIIREFKILSQLRHPNIIQVYDYSKTDDGRAFFTLEYIHGQPINSYFKTYSKKLLSAILQVIEALGTIHEKGFVHCDLKPEHILYIPKQEKAVLIDFGFAGDVSAKIEQAGTIGYIAPEVFKGIGIDGRADLYSLGIIIYEIIAGAKPKETFKPIREITEELNNILARLFSKEPSIRPSIIELQTTFNKYIPSIKLKKTSYKTILPKTGFVKIPEIFEALSKTKEKAIIFIGDTGSGKTRLLKELKFEYLMDGCEVFFYSPKQGVNFLNELCRFISFDSFNTSQYEDKFQVYDEILKQLLKLAKHKQIIIMVDDGESLSDYELHLFRYIGYGLKNSSILLIGVSKPDEKIQNLGFATLILRPFNRNETHELLEKTFLKIDPIEPFTKWLHENSGGNPLFIVEILNALFDNNLLYYRSSKWCIEKKSLNKIKIPKKIEQLLLKRIKNLDNIEKRILEIISLCDIPLDIQILNHIIQAEIYTSLERLKTNGLLKEEVINKRVVYALPNRILKTITTDSLTKKEKQSLQNKLLLAIKEIYPREDIFIPILAALYFSSGKKKQASEYYLKVAKNAEKIFDYESSLTYYGKYAQCIQDIKPKKYPETLMKIANVNQLIGNNKPAIDYYKKTLTYKNAKLNKEIYLRLGKTYSTIGEHKKAVIYYKKSLSHTAKKNTRKYIETINALGYSLLYLNKFKEAELLFSKSLTLSKNISDLEMEAESRYYQAVFEWFKNNYGRGIKKAKKNLAFTKKNKLQKQYAYTANLLSSLYQQKNEITQAQKYLDEAITVLKKIKHINTLCGALNSQALFYREQGNLTKSMELFYNVLLQAQQINIKTNQYISLMNLAIINRETGKFDTAISCFERASHIDPDKPDPIYGIAITLYTKGEIDKAKSLIEQKIAINRDILYYFAMAVIESVRGKYESAEKLINKGVKKIGAVNPDTEIKVEAFLRASQFYYEKSDFKSSLNCAMKLKNLTNVLSREHNIGSALIKVMNYNLKKTDEIDINKEIARLKEIGCIYDWAWIKKLCIESILNRGIAPTQIKLIAQELTEIEAIFTSLGAELELGRLKKIQEKLFPIIVKDYSRRIISNQYLEIFSQLALLINQHLGDKDFIQRILDLIIRATGAERGALFIKSTSAAGSGTTVSRRELAGGMEFVAGRDIDHTTIKDAGELSKTAIMALQKKQIIFSTDALHDAKFSSKKSVMLHQIRSLMCIPLVVGDNIIGAIYVDSRLSKGIFGSQDKDFLLTVSQILASVIEKSIVFKQIIDENIFLKTKILQEIGTGYLIGKSKGMKEIYKLIEDIATTDSPVLITGETGTGKGMIARFIHLKSKRRDNKFLPINCGTITETLFESELFGHKRGSFTGAVSDKKGLLEEAEAGTVFLDEITNTSIAFQAKLLEAIEEKLIRRVGETNTRKINVRFLFATNKDLDFEVEDGRFRKDLFYRINVFRIEVPPLREREKDIPLLTRFFLERYCEEFNKHIEGFTPEVLIQLKKQFWPGNVRELQNVIEKAVIRTKGNIITTESIGFEKKREIPISLKEMKKEAIIEALNASNRNIKKAAKLLDINRKTIHRYIKQYGIKIKQE